MKEYEFTSHTCEVYYEVDNIEFISNFDWRFGKWDDEGNLEIEVDHYDSYQVINGVRHYFHPDSDEMASMIEYIQDHILEDPNDFGFEEHIESEKDFYQDNREY